MNIKSQIPNTITCGNLLCGCLALIRVFDNDLHTAAYLVGVAAVLDFLDGFAARMLHAYSPVGKDLDSLADLVTFGVVPGMVMFKMITFLSGTGASDAFSEFRTNPGVLLPYAGLLIIIFSAIRLARFNNDTRQSESFIGLPVPANAILICSLPLVYNFTGSYQAVELGAGAFITDPSNLAILSCMLSLLLVTELPLFSLKFKSFGWTGNEIRFLFLLSSIVLLAVFKLAGIPLVIVFYVLFSIVNNIFLKKKV